MYQTMRTSNLDTLAVLCMSSLTTAFLFPIFYTHNYLFSRDAIDTLSCPQATSIQCGNGLPGDFCCASDSYCTILAHNTTAICCPNGADCASIAPLSCNIQVQNVTLYPTTVVMTTNLTAVLQSCGSACCPHGYTCLNGACSQNANQGNTIAKSSSFSKLASATTSSYSRTASATKSATDFATTTSVTKQDVLKYPAAAVVLGFFPGLIFGILITLILICLIGVRNARTRSSSSLSLSLPSSATSPFGKVAASIHDPIYGDKKDTVIARVKKSEISGPTLLRANTTTGNQRFLSRSIFSSKNVSEKGNNIQLIEQDMDSVRGRLAKHSNGFYPSEQDGFSFNSSSTTPLSDSYIYEPTPPQLTQTRAPTSHKSNRGNTSPQHSRFISLNMNDRLPKPSSIPSTSDSLEHERDLALKSINSARHSHPIYPLPRQHSLYESLENEVDSGMYLGSPKWGADVPDGRRQESRGEVRKKPVIIGIMPGVRT